MHLKSLSLRQFRNFPRLDLFFGPRLNIFIGPNGSGKSNILEAIAVVATSQSHRGVEPRHWVQEGKDELALLAQADGEESLSIDIRQKKGRVKQVRHNNRPQSRARDWAGKIPLVAFSPDDLDLVKGEPGLRRRALNDLLSQVDAAYADALARYARVLEERNAALRRVREGAQKASILEPWDLAILKDGAALSLARHVFLSEFAGRVQRRQAELSTGLDRVTLIYRPSFHLASESVEEIAEMNRRRLLDLREGEIALGSTLIGPHRDDVEFRLDDDPAKNRASQGQCRTLALAWVLEERAHLKETLNREPLCLFDDVFSELDPGRRERLTEVLSGGAQGFVTLADFSTWPEGGRAAKTEEARVFHVQAGAVLDPQTV